MNVLYQLLLQNQYKLNDTKYSLDGVIFNINPGSAVSQAGMETTLYIQFAASATLECPEILQDINNKVLDFQFSPKYLDESASQIVNFICGASDTPYVKSTVIITKSGQNVLKVQLDGSEITLLTFETLSSALNPLNSGFAAMDFDYVKANSAALTSKNHFLSDTVFPILLNVLDTFGNPAQQQCCKDCFVFNTASDAVASVSSASFDVVKQQCAVYVSILINAFRQDMTLAVSYLDIELKGTSNSLNLKVQKDSDWAVTINVVVGCLFILTSIVTFVYVFECQRRRELRLGAATR